MPKKLLLIRGGAEKVGRAGSRANLSRVGLKSAAPEVLAAAASRGYIAPSEIAGMISPWAVRNQRVLRNIVSVVRDYLVLRNIVIVTGLERALVRVLPTEIKEQVDERLVALQGEFGRVYDNSFPEIFRYCYRRIRDRERSQDLAQDAFAKTWEFLSKGGKVRNLRAFTYAVVKNLIVDEVRSRGRKGFVSIEVMQDAGWQLGYILAEAGEERVNWQKAMAALKQLSPRDRKLIKKRYVQGLRVKDIARSVNMRPNTVDVRLHRSIKRLQEVLGRPA